MSRPPLHLVGGGREELQPLAESLPALSFDHLRLLMDDTGLFEHTWQTVPRREHGYTTDDVARGLVVLGAQPHLPVDLLVAEHRFLAFLRHARLTGGRFHNRLGYDRRWRDQVGSDDCAGRALWGLGVAVTGGHDPQLQDAAAKLFVEATSFHSSHARSNAYAILGAAAAVDVVGSPARSLLDRCADNLPRPMTGRRWIWPTERLSYANARIPEAMIAAGSASGNSALVEAGIYLLDWLVAVETRGGHFSFTPVGGRGPGEVGPAFDQQPIEAWGMADACSRAFRATGDPLWRTRSLAAAAWFIGSNDLGVALYDEATGGCADGLTPEGPSLNQGAESTLSALGALTTAAGAIA